MRRPLFAALALVAGAVLGAGCGQEEPAAPATMELSSPAFEAGGSIPVKHTCDGDDVSPPLAWSNQPPETVTYALIMDDPDARGVAGRVWVHWVVYNVPGFVEKLAEGVPRSPDLPSGAHQGRGDSGVGYHGPCPPPGGDHHYRFTIYAVDTVLGLQSGATREELLKALAGHVLARGELVGTYRRQ